MSRRRKIKSASPSMAAGDVGVADTAKNSCNNPPRYSKWHEGDCTEG